MTDFSKGEIHRRKKSDRVQSVVGRKPSLLPPSINTDRGHLRQKKHNKISIQKKQTAPPLPILIYYKGFIKKYLN